MKRNSYAGVPISGNRPFRKRWLFALLTCLVGLLLPYAALGQVGAASLSGVVQDPTSAFVAGATVTLTNVQNGMERTATTNDSGAFYFAAVPSGDYHLTIKMSGFRDLFRSGIHLSPGDALALQGLSLNLASTAETVSVEGTVSNIPLDSGQLSSTIATQDIDRLSIVGRDVTELQKILPGFAIHSQDNTNTASDYSQVNMDMGNAYVSNGAPVAGTTLKLDGANLTDAGNMGASLQNINPAFISEVQVQTSNFGVDQANGPVIISGVTKPGTQAYHGSFYTYARTSALNSNDSLAKFNGIARPNDRYLYPGLTFSGPVPKTNKKLTFFFGTEFDAQKNVYAYNSASSAIVNALVPTARMRQGDFSADALREYLGPMYGNGGYATIFPTPTVGDDGSALSNGNIGQFLDPGAMALVNATLPLPNMPTNAFGYNYQTMNLVNNNIFQTTGRVDYAINPRNTFFVRYSFERGNQGQPEVPYYAPISVMGAVNTPGGGLLNKPKVHTASANWVTVFSPTLTNELAGTLTYYSQVFAPKDQSALLKSTIDYPYNGVFDNGSLQYPQLGTYTTYGGLPLGLWPDFTTGGLFLHKFQPAFSDNLSKVAGKHVIKVGFFGQRVTNNQANQSQANGVIQNYWFGDAGNQLHSYAGSYPDGSPAFDPTPHFNSGNALADFFEGQIQDFHQTSTTPRTNIYYWTLEGYAQDAWRVRQNVVVTYGLRLSYLGAWQDSHGLGAAVWNPDLIGTAWNATTNPYPGFEWHALNSKIENSGTGSPAPFVQPRVGIAWDVFGTGKTVVRGGFGVYKFHDSADDVIGAFQTASGLRTADLQGFSGNTLAGVSTVHQDPNTYGNAGGTQTTLPVGTIKGLLAADNKVPVTRNYSLSIAHQLNRTTLIQFSYAGNQSDSMMNNGTTQAVVLNNINAIPVGYLFTPEAAAKIDAETAAKAPWMGVPCNPTGCTPQQAAQLSNLENWPGQPSVQAARPFPQYGSIIVPQHNTYANYNGFQALLVKQSGNLTYNINYTFSKALGILGSAADFNYTAPVDPFRMRNNYGPMNYDRTHILNFSYSYQFGKVTSQHALGLVANDWLISGITTLQSGGNMQTGVSFSPDFYLQGTINDPNGAYPINNQTILGTPDVSLQPVLTCDPRKGLGTNQFINGSCFGVPATGTNGTFILPYMHGPAYFNSDVSLEKSFTVGEGRRLRFRYAAFNFLNHPLHSFGTPYPNQTTLILAGTSPANATSTNTNFGYAPLTIGRRLSEISLRFEF
jgi:hypothetical protein